jgi:hypothetical protein
MQEKILQESTEMDEGLLMSQFKEIWDDWHANAWLFLFMVKFVQAENIFMLNFFFEWIFMVKFVETFLSPSWSKHSLNTIRLGIVV